MQPFLVHQERYAVDPPLHHDLATCLRLKLIELEFEMITEKRPETRNMTDERLLNTSERADRRWTWESGF